MRSLASSSPWARYADSIAILDVCASCGVRDRGCTESVFGATQPGTCAFPVRSPVLRRTRARNPRSGAFLHHGICGPGLCRLLGPPTTGSRCSVRVGLASNRRPPSRGCRSGPSYGRPPVVHRGLLLPLYQEEGLIATSPAVHVRRPPPRLRVPSDRLGPQRSGRSPGRRRARPALEITPLSACLPSMGFAVSEAIGANIEALGLERGHRTLTILRKGGRRSPSRWRLRTARAIDLAVGERCQGPIFLDDSGGRLDRHAAARIVRRVARRAGIAKRVGPHTLRHASITAALDSGVPLRDVQEAASHADPRTTMRYDRVRASLTGTPPTSSRRSLPAPPDSPGTR